MSVARPASATAAPVRTRAAILIATVAVATAVNLVVAALATALGAPAGYPALSAPALITFTVVPLTIGWFVWQPLARRVRRPQRTLVILAAVVLVVSFVPDLILLATGFIPGTTLAAVLGLMTAHVVVLAAAVVGYTAALRR